MINMSWLKQNFADNSTIFVVGCADLSGEATQIKNEFKKSKMYAFECSDTWLTRNIDFSLKSGIHYFHAAVFSENSNKMFIPSVSENGESHPWSGTFYKDIYTESKKVYGEPYEVRTIRIDTFCNTFGIEPDFIFVDAEGSEYEVLNSLGDVRPKAIWVEIVGFSSYETNKTFDEFNSLMDILGYNLVYPTDETNPWNSPDALYCLKNFEFTEYTHEEI